MTGEHLESEGKRDFLRKIGTGAMAGVAAAIGLSSKSGSAEAEITPRVTGTAEAITGESKSEKPNKKGEGQEGEEPKEGEKGGHSPEDDTKKEHAPFGVGAKIEG